LHPNALTIKPCSKWYLVTQLLASLAFWRWVRPPGESFYGVVVYQGRMPFWSYGFLIEKASFLGEAALIKCL